MGRKSLADTRKNEILEAFYKCVIKEGFSYASIRKIAKEANIQPSVIHHYFKDRNEMIEMMVANYANIIFGHFESEIKPITDSEQRLSHALQYLFSFNMINKEFTGFFFECLVESRRNTKVREIVSETFRRFRNAIIDFIDEVEAFKDCSRNRKKAYASMIVALHEGMEMQWFANPEDVSLEETFNLIQEFIELMTQGKMEN